MPEDRIDAARAEQILKDGLAVPGVLDRKHLVKRLASLYEETGRTAEAASLLECFPDPSMQSQKQTVDDSTRESSLDDIIAELDAEYTGKLPEQAVRAAQRRREEIIPRLIDLIRKATETARAGNGVEANGHLFALFLLTEFEATEALPAILEAVSLSGEGPFELFGDAITEDLCRVLAALAAETPEIIDELIANRSLNTYVRWAAASAYLLWVRDGLLTRDQAVARLREHLSEAVINRDAELAGGLVAELVSYAPDDALDEIKEAFRGGLVDRGLVGSDTVQQSIAEGESRFREELQFCRLTGVQDTVTELSRWASFREDADDSGYSCPAPVSSTWPGEDWDIGLDDEEPWEPATTILNTAPKIGRNDPCPCGSGKKYKECCGSR